MSAPLQPSLLTGVRPLSGACERGTCSACGQNLPRAFKHTLSKGLIGCLWKLYHSKRPCQLRDVGLTTTEFANFQKLSYFRLAWSSGDGWELSARGLLFLGNRIEVAKHVFTKAGKVVEQSQQLIRVSDVDENWKDRYWFSQNARAVN